MVAASRQNFLPPQGPERVQGGGPDRGLTQLSPDLTAEEDPTRTRQNNLTGENVREKPHVPNLPWRAENRPAQAATNAREQAAESLPAGFGFLNFADSVTNFPQPNTTAAAALDALHQEVLTAQQQERDPAELNALIFQKTWEALLQDPAVGRQASEAIAQDLAISIDPRDPFDFLTRHPEVAALAANLPELARSFGQLENRLSENVHVQAGAETRTYEHAAKLALEPAFRREHLAEFEALSDFEFTGADGELAGYLRRVKELRTAVAVTAEAALTRYQQTHGEAVGGIEGPERVFREAGKELQERVDSTAQIAIAARLKELALDDTNLNPATRYGEFASYFTANVGERRSNDHYNLHLPQDLEQTHPELIPGIDREYGVRGTDFDFLSKISQAQQIDRALLRLRSSQFEQHRELQSDLEARYARLDSQELDIKLDRQTAMTGATLQLGKPVSLEQFAAHVFQTEPANLTPAHFRLLSETNPALAPSFDELRHKSAADITLPTGSVSISSTQVGAELREAAGRVALAVAKIAEPVLSDTLRAEARTDPQHQATLLQLEHFKLELKRDGLSIGPATTSALPEITVDGLLSAKDLVQRVYGKPLSEEDVSRKLGELLEANPQLKELYDSVRLSRSTEYAFVPAGMSLKLPYDSELAGRFRTIAPPTLAELQAQTAALHTYATEHGMEVRVTEDRQVQLRLIKPEQTYRLLETLIPTNVRFGQIEDQGKEWLADRQLDSHPAIQIPAGRTFSITDSALGRQFLAAADATNSLHTRIDARTDQEDALRRQGFEPVAAPQAEQTLARTLSDMPLSQLAQSIYGGAELENIDRLLAAQPQLKAITQTARNVQDDAETFSLSEVTVPAGTIVQMRDSRLSSAIQRIRPIGGYPAAANDVAFIAADSDAGLSIPEIDALREHSASTAAYVSNANSVANSAALREELADISALIPKAAVEPEMEQRLADRITAFRETNRGMLTSDPASLVPELAIVQAELRELRIAAATHLGTARLQRGDAPGASRHFREALPLLREELALASSPEDKQRIASTTVGVQLNLTRSELAESELPAQLLQKVQSSALSKEAAREQLAPLIQKLQRDFEQSRAVLAELPDAGEERRALTIAQHRLTADIYGRAGDLELRHKHLTQATAVLMSNESQLSRSDATQLFDSATGEVDRSLIARLWSGQRIQSYTSDQRASLSTAYGKLSPTERAHVLDLLEEMSSTAGQLQDEHAANLHSELFSTLAKDHHSSDSFDDRAVGVRADVVRAHKLMAQSEDSLGAGLQELYLAERKAEQLLDPVNESRSISQKVSQLQAATDPTERETLVAQINTQRDQLRRHEALVQGIHSGQLNLVTERNSLLRTERSASDVSAVVSRITGREAEKIEDLERERAALHLTRTNSVEQRLAELPQSEHAKLRATYEAEYAATDEGKLNTARLSAIDSEIAFRQRSQMQVRLQEVAAYVHSAAAKTESSSRTPGTKLNAQQMLDKLEADFEGTAVAADATRIVRDFREAKEEGKIAVLKQALYEINSSSIAETLLWTQTAGLAGAGIASFVATPLAAPVGYGIGNFVGWAGLSAKNLYVGRERIALAYDTGLTTISDAETWLNGISLGLELIPFGGGLASGAKRIGLEGVQSIISPAVLAKQIRMAALSQGRDITEHQAARLARTSLLNTAGKEMFEFGGKALTVGGMGFALGPAAAQLIEIQNNPQLTDHQKAKMSRQVYRQLATLALNMTVTQGVSIGINAASSVHALDVGRIRTSLLDTENRVRANREADRALSQLVPETQTVQPVRDANTPALAPSTLAARVSRANVTVQTTGGRPVGDVEIKQAQGIVRRIAAEDRILTEPAVVLAEGNPQFDAAFDWVNNRILINRNVDSSRLPELLAHEMDHAHQVQFAAAAHAAGRRLPPNFYVQGPDGRRTGETNINPAIMQSVRETPTSSGPGKYFENEMVQEWGVKLARSLAAGADMHAVGNREGYEAQFAEVLARFQGFDADRSQALSKANELFEQSTQPGANAAGLQALAEIELKRATELAAQMQQHLDVIADRLASGELDPRTGLTTPLGVRRSDAEGLAFAATNDALELPRTLPIDSTYDLANRFAEGENLTLIEKAELYRNLPEEELPLFTDDQVLDLMSADEALLTTYKALQSDFDVAKLSEAAKLLTDIEGGRHLSELSPQQRRVLDAAAVVARTAESIPSLQGSPEAQAQLATEVAGLFRVKAITPAKVEALIRAHGDDAVAVIRTASDLQHYFDEPGNYTLRERAALEVEVRRIEADFPVHGPNILGEVIDLAIRPEFVDLNLAELQLQTSRDLAREQNIITPQDVEAIVSRFNTPEEQQVAREMLFHMTKYTQVGGARAPQLQVGARPAYDVPVEGLISLRTDLIDAGKITLNTGASKILYTPGSGTLADTLVYLTNRKLLGGTGPREATKSNIPIPTTDDVSKADYILVDDAVLTRLNTDPSFARAVIDNNVELVIPAGHFGGSRLGSADVADARLQRQVTEGVRRYREQSVPAAPIDTVGELSARLQTLIEANAHGNKTHAVELSREFVERAEQLAASSNTTVEDGFQYLVTDLDERTRVFREVNAERSASGLTEIAPASLSDLRLAADADTGPKPVVEGSVAADPRKLRAALVGHIEAQIHDSLASADPDYRSRWTGRTTAILPATLQTNLTETIASQLNGTRRPSPERVLEQVDAAIENRRQELAGGGHFPTRELTFQERTLIYEAFAEATKMYDTRTFNVVLKDLHIKIQDQAQAIAQQRGRTLVDTELYLVSPPGFKSHQIVTNMYAEANGIPPARVLSINEFRELRQSRIDRGEDVSLMIPVVLDDLAGSGNTLLRVGAEVIDGQAREAADAKMFWADRQRNRAQGQPLILAPVESTGAAERNITRNVGGTGTSFVSHTQAVQLNETQAFKRYLAAITNPAARKAAQSRMETFFGQGYDGKLTATAFPWGDSNTNSRLWQAAVGQHFLPTPDAVNQLDRFQLFGRP